MECARYDIFDPLNLLLFQVWPDMRSGLQAAPCSPGARIWEGSAARALGMRRLRLARLPDGACASGRRLHPERAGQGGAAGREPGSGAAVCRRRAGDAICAPFTLFCPSRPDAEQAINRFPSCPRRGKSACFPYKLIGSSNANRIGQIYRQRGFALFHESVNLHFSLFAYVWERYSETVLPGKAACLSALPETTDSC